MPHDGDPEDHMKIAQDEQEPEVLKLPQYNRQGQVGAMMIASVSPLPRGGARICPMDASLPSVKVDANYIERHMPRAGGYYIVCEDGHKGFSPAKAFEDGHTLIEE